MTLYEVHKVQVCPQLSRCMHLIITIFLDGSEAHHKELRRRQKFVRYESKLDADVFRTGE